MADSKRICRLSVILAMVPPVILASSARSVVGQLALGPEQIVQAGGTDLAVPGYSVPSLVFWDGDDRLDLIVGEGSGSSAAKVRMYLGVGQPCAPEFSAFSYAQSSVGDLVVPGSG
ncbi:MAG: hypothetical protein GY778_09990 [bacterium]|nr:hypothetical protein [bacterium]